MVKKITIILCFLFWPWGAVFSARPDQTVRVALLVDTPKIYLRVVGYFEVCDLDNAKQIYKGKNLKKQLIWCNQDRIAFSEIKLSSPRIKIRPLKKGLIYVNNRPFRGEINLINKGPRSMLVVNELSLEDYCQGVLPYEVAYWWPLEALKAQAVVARTYAFYHKRFTADKDYDLTSDIYSQVYGGKTAQRWRTNRAVGLTQDEVLKFQGDVFATYYHASCAGHTEDANNLWKVDISPLKGVACGYCLKSPHYNWRIGISLEDIRSRLLDKGFQIDKIDTIEVLGRNGSGRITELKIGSFIKNINISAKDFRQALGPNVIRSTNFTLKIISGLAYFEGLGWGHGVGLCQWGAFFMAQKGLRYKQILQYYFPQSQLSLLN